MNDLSDLEEYFKNENETAQKIPIQVICTKLDTGKT